MKKATVKKTSISSGISVVLLSSEVVPFAKTGGLADVAAALPEALASLGLKLSVFMPLYGSVSSRKYAMKSVSRLRLTIRGKNYTYSVYRTSRNKVNFYFIRQKELFDRPGLYGSAKGEYPDNADEQHGKYPGLQAQQETGAAGDFHLLLP